MEKKNVDNSSSHFIIYQSESGETKVDIKLQGKTVWMTKTQIARLFQVPIEAIDYYLKKIFSEEELFEHKVSQKRPINHLSDKKNLHYNLNAILAISFRLKSPTAKKLRKWMNQHIQQFIVKGFLIDQDRLQHPEQPYTYFSELKEIIKEIRAIEQPLYQQVLTIFSTSVDFDPNSNISIDFFKIAHDKLLFAITKLTAIEIFMKRADHKKLDMGLKRWRGPRIRTEDVILVNNYLTVNEKSKLENLVNLYIEKAEQFLMDKQPMSMQQWINLLNDLIKKEEFSILETEKKNFITRQMAQEHALEQFKLFNKL